jgi:hypothetical protein
VRLIESHVSNTSRNQLLLPFCFVLLTPSGMTLAVGRLVASMSKIPPPTNVQPGCLSCVRIEICEPKLNQPAAGPLR